MPIKGWSCPHCSDKRAALDHYETTDCGLKIHPAYAAAILHDEATNTHGSELSVTNGLSCPRSRAIEGQAEVYVNPVDYNALLIGRGWDTIIAQGGKVQLRGKIAGLEITGELDNIRRLGGRLIISDWKHSNNFRQKWIKQEGGPSMEYKIQTSVYAELYAQMNGERPTHGEVVYHFSGAGKPDMLLPYLYDIIPLKECLAFKPYGGQYTVLDLYQQAAPIYTGHKRWTDLPLVGKTMAFGSKEFCDYCQVREACFTQATGAPF